jgi:hypothetical protein
MAIYNLHECGHYSTNDPWGKGDDVKVYSLCLDCKKARIGEVIEFARFGKPPASGVSTNHREGTSEEGVSVYEVVNSEPKLVGWHFGITERQQFRGTGIIVGWGSDGEPLVKILKIRKTK